MAAVTEQVRTDVVAAGGRPWFPGWRPLATPVVAWAASRLVVLGAIAVGNHLRGNWGRMADALRIWDGNWYLTAAEGYDYPAITPEPFGQVDIAFFPLFPLLIRGLAALTGWTILTAGIVVATVFGALAVVAIWLLLHHLAGRQVADRTALLVAFFPGSIALTLIYSEGVMLTAAAGCLLALTLRRWEVAGLLGALASAARPNGLAVAVACAVASGLAIRATRDWRSLIAPVVAPLGAVAYWAWLWFKTGSAGVWLRIQREGWGEGIDFGRALIRDLQWYGRLFHDLDFLGLPMIVHLRVAGLIFVGVAAVLMVRWRPPAILWTYAAAIMLATLLAQTLGARPRFVLTAFPLIAAVAWNTRGVVYQVILGASGALLALSAIIYTTPGVVAP